MRQVQINKERQAARARRHREREQTLPLDPRDPDIARARANLRSATGARRARFSGSSSCTPSAAARPAAVPRHSRIAAAVGLIHARVGTAP